MRLAGRSVLTASAAVAAVTCVALAQGTCETNLAGRVHLPSFQPWSPGNTPHPLVFQIGGALWRVIVAHNPTDSSNGVLWFVPDSQYLAPVISEFNQAATGDTA